MKLLLTTGLYPPEPGGPATHAAMVEESLPERGIEVTVLPFSVVRNYPKVIRHLRYAWKSWMLSRNVDVIYALDPVSVGVPSAVVALLRRKPLVLRLGGDYAWEQGRERFGVTELLDQFVRNRQPSVRVRLLQKLQTWVARRAVAVVVPSQYLGKIIEQWGIDKTKIHVIYSVYKPLQEVASKHEARHELQLTGHVIYSVGRLVPWKGFSTLIKVVANLQAEFPDVHLYIGGSGSQRSVLEELIHTLNFHHCVTLVDAVAGNRELSGKYKKAADVFVLNTGYEGLSHDLLEAMALDTPIVTTAVGGNPELITNGREGLLVTYDDAEALYAAIKRVLSNEQLQQRLALAARVRVQDFTKERSVTALQELLQSIHGYRP